MPSASPSDDLAVLRESQDRRLEREGIPMVVALVSEVSPDPTVSGAPEQDGVELSRRMDAMRDSLAPNQRDGDMGVLISVLQAVAYADFDRSVLATRS